MSGNAATTLADLQTAATLSRRSLDKIGEGEWTPQDSAHHHIVMTVEKFLAGDPQLRTGRIVHGDLIGDPNFDPKGDDELSV